MNEETERYLAVSAMEIQQAARATFRPENSAALIYVPKQVNPVQPALEK
jgi:hypothetical protein